ncbi:hypothetical protein [uncultured Planococcus sp.]|uniref:hypothetical protein n=1 Tax=uncultured Planococcus sp. TaxID=337815 RepID=UPI0026121633|nr:hypothetical protein [uncultured Planococcus sp.]
MNVLSRVLCAATGIHIAHFVAFAAFGYMKIRTLEWKAVRANADILLNEKVFGKAPSPVLYAETFIGIALACQVLLGNYKLFNGKGGSL